MLNRVILVLGFLLACALLFGCTSPTVTAEKVIRLGENSCIVVVGPDSAPQQYKVIVARVEGRLSIVVLENGNTVLGWNKLPQATMLERKVVDANGDVRMLLYKNAERNACIERPWD